MVWEKGASRATSSTTSQTILLFGGIVYAICPAQYENVETLIMQRTCDRCEREYGDENTVKICPTCGNSLAVGEMRSENSRESVPTKSPALAGLLSFLMVGMGQIYIGQIEKGLTMIAVVLLLIVTVVLGPLGLLILLFNVIDAFMLARTINKGRTISKWQFFFQSR